MPRIAWDGVRVRRLSAGAVSLLALLSKRDTCLLWAAGEGTAQGIYHFCNGHGPTHHVQGRTIEALLGPRLITRDRASNTPRYVIAEAGRVFLRQHQRAVCAAQGRDCMGCELKECAFDP